MVAPDTTTDIEATVDRVDRALGLLIDRRRSPCTHSSPVKNAIEISIRREGEKLCWRQGHDALIEAAMLITVRNPNHTRNDRTALLEALWAEVSKSPCADSSQSVIQSSPMPCPSIIGDGEATEISIMRAKKTKKTKTSKAGKKVKRVAARAKPAVKRSAA
jgi:hypothetical protein